MKKPSLALVLLPILALASCGKNAPEAGLYYLEKGEVKELSKLKLYFPQSSDIPYLSLEDAFGILTLKRRDLIGKDDFTYGLDQTQTTAVATDDNGTKANFDVEKQTIVIEDFDRFVFGAAPGQSPLAMAAIEPTMKSIKQISDKSSFTQGKAVTLNLSSYGLNMYPAEGGHGILIPLATFSDIFVGADLGFSGLAYNYTDVFFSTSGLKGMNSSSLNALGKRFYQTAPKRATVSPTIADFTFRETAFNLDHFYGLKGIRGIDSFATYAEQAGLKGAMLSGNLATMEKAYATMLMRGLKDGHTSYFLPSAFRDYDDYELDSDCLDPAAVAKQQQEKEMNEQRSKKKLEKCFQVVGDTAFIYFDDFEEIDEKTLYGTLTEEAAELNNPVLFAYAYQQLAELKKAGTPVRNVVVDLVTNNGGDATGLAYCLGTLLGEVSFDTLDPLTGARNHATFRTDINVDGVIDEKDVPLCNEYNIAMLDSKFAFSCGNYFPVAAKALNPKVKILGDVTGGGTCALKTNFTPLGSTYFSSGLVMLQKKTAQGYTHVEDGAAVDYPIAYDKMFDRDYIVQTLASTVFPK